MLLLGRGSAANAGKVWGIIDRQVLLHGLRTAPFFSKWRVSALLRVGHKSVDGRKKLY